MAASTVPARRPQRARPIPHLAGWREAFPELEVPDSLGRSEFSFVDPLTFDGELASVLVWGGAYIDFDGTIGEAKALAQMCCEVMFGAAYYDTRAGDWYKAMPTSQGTRVVHLPGAWSPWFYDIAWDYTWVVADGLRDRAWLLCVTHTD